MSLAYVPESLAELPMGLDLDDLRAIGRGCSRVAYAVSPTLVLKVAQPAMWAPGEECGSLIYGCEANERECALWDQACPRLSAILCPVVTFAEDYSWVLMERAQTFASFERASKERGQDLLDYFFAEVEWAGFEDMHEGNFGFLEGRFVAIDYES